MRNNWLNIIAGAISFIAFLITMAVLGGKYVICAIVGFIIIAVVSLFIFFYVSYKIYSSEKIMNYIKEKGVGKIKNIIFGLTVCLLILEGIIICSLVGQYQLLFMSFRSIALLAINIICFSSIFLLMELDDRKN